MRVAVATLMLVGLMALLPAAAAAKQGMSAELLKQLSPAAEPGSTLELEWKLTVLEGSKRVPFDAMGVFVRLLDVAGGTPSTALARGSSHPDGLYSASIVVPSGGISGIQIGLHGTTDVFAAVLNNPFALNRPLHLPVLAPGAKCPVATSDPAIPFASLYRVGKGLGAGPAFPILGSGSTLRYAPPINFQSARWGGQKVLWFVLPSYTGPVLIRGGRLDRPGRIGFERGNIPVLALRLDSSTVIPGGGPVPDNARYRPSYTRLTSPGCYAYQVDGTTFSRTIVFRAVRGY
jgi:hypothetical protein